MTNRCAGSATRTFRKAAFAAWMVVPSLTSVPEPLTPSGPGLARDSTRWIGTWATAPQPPLPGTLRTFSNQTIRLVIRSSAGGAAVRIRVSNVYGDTPLRLGGAHIARRTTAEAIDPASDRTLTFGGRADITIAAGSMAVSDPVRLDIPPLGDLAISLFLPQPTPATTTHQLAQQTSYVSLDTGDLSARATLPNASPIQVWPFLTGVDVEASTRSASLVAYGSSTTDGDGSTMDANRRWPDVLAERLQARASSAHTVGVLNLGIIGNRLLRDSPPTMRAQFGFALGESGLKRFDRDVLAQPGVESVVLSLGVNDIAFPGEFAPATERVRARDIIAGYRDLIARAHRKHIRAFVATIHPFGNSSRHTAAKERVRTEVNRWIRTSREHDGVFDFDAAVRDPKQPTRLHPDFDSGDHVHTNDAGYVAMATLIPLSLFVRE
jgi:lysophospholipase L1-like esterase